MHEETYEATVVILTAIVMCGGAGALWLWSDRSAKAIWLIGGLWLVIVVAALIVGSPWDIGAMAATVMGVLLLTRWIQSGATGGARSWPESRSGRAAVRAPAAPPPA